MRVFYCNGKKDLCYDNDKDCDACEYCDNTGGQYVQIKEAENDMPEL